MLDACYIHNKNSGFSWGVWMRYPKFDAPLSNYLFFVFGAIDNMAIVVDPHDLTPYNRTRLNERPLFVHKG